MKYIYGLNKSGLSLINHLSKTSESFIAWDDNEKRRQKISLTFKDIVFKHPEDLNLSKVKEAFITPGISLNEKKIFVWMHLDFVILRALMEGKCQQ